MIDLISFWYLLPIGIVIATLYTSTGISGANFWAPVYLLWLKIDPLVGFWLALVSMLFGSIGGLIGHTRHKTINYFLVKKYLLVTVPFAFFGALLIPFVNPLVLFFLFGSFVIVYGSYLFHKTHKTEQPKMDKHEKIHYFLGSIGGFLTGLISVGLGKLILPHCIKHKRVIHHSEAVGTTLVIVFVTSIVAVLTRLNPIFIESLKLSFEPVVSMLIYVIPGVLIGGQIGPVIAKRLNLKTMKIYIAILLILIGILMFIRGFSLF